MVAPVLESGLQNDRNLEMIKDINSCLHPFQGDIVFIYWPHILMTWSLEQHKRTDGFCSFAGCYYFLWHPWLLLLPLWVFCLFLQTLVHFLNFDMPPRIYNFLTLVLCIYSIKISSSWLKNNKCTYFHCPRPPHVYDIDMKWSQLLFLTYHGQVSD